MGGRGSGRRSVNSFIPATDRPEYDRQPNESDKAWNAFTIYRDMGFERTLDKVRLSLGKIPGYRIQIENWSSRWGWRERCEAWDRELDRIARKNSFTEVEKMKERHVQLALSLLGLGAVELNKWLSFVRAADQRNNRTLNASEVLKLIEAGIKLERACRGEPETIIEERHQLTATEERESLRAVLSDPKTLKVVDELLDALNGNPTKKKSRK